MRTAESASLRVRRVAECLCGLALLFSTIVSSTSAYAQVVAPAAGIEVMAEAHRADFPKSVVFDLDARGDERIEKATLRFKQLGQNTVTTAAVDFEPAHDVDLTYTWDLQRYYVPPGVAVEYYWLLEDAKGYRQRTPSRTFALEDERFDWKQLADGPVRLHWYAGDDSFAAELLKATRGALDQLGRDAGVQTDTPVKVYLYANQRDLLSALRPSAQEWTGGQAFSAQGIVVAAVEPTSAGLDFGRRVLPHEVSHVIIHKATDNPYGDIPRWLDEGLAMYAEGSLEPPYERALSRAVSDNSLFTVQSLSANFPTDSQAALLSYAQSHSLVKFVVERYGRDRLSDLLAIFREGSAYDPALESALGVDAQGLDSAWRQWVGAPAAPARGPGQEGRRWWPNAPVAVAVAAGVTLGAVVLLIVAYRSLRRKGPGDSDL